MHRARTDWVARIIALLVLTLAAALVVASILTAPKEGLSVPRTARTLAALTITAAASILLAGPTAADVNNSGPTASCTRSLLCQVNVPVDAHNLLTLNQPLLGGLL